MASAVSNNLDSGSVIIPDITKYDFTKEFFHPTISPSDELFTLQNPDFSTMLTLNMRKLTTFHSGSVGKFDYATYFLHFFLGMIYGGRESDLKTKLGLEDLFWYYDPVNSQLKVFITSNNQDEKKLSLKCFNFKSDADNIKTTGQSKTWPENDLKNVIVEMDKMKKNVKDYKIESHWYEVMVENLVYPGERHKLASRKPVKFEHTVSPDVFFTQNVEKLNLEQEFIDRTIKLKRKVQKNFQRAEEIFTENDINQHEMENSLKEMFRMDKIKQVEQQLKTFLNSANRIYREGIQQGQFGQDMKSSRSDSHCGFLHGLFVNFQTIFNFQAKILHKLDTEPPGYAITLKRILGDSWQTIKNDNPIRIEIAPNLQKTMGRKSTKNVIQEASVQHVGSSEEILVESVSKKGVAAFLNFNAEEGKNLVTVVSKIADPAFTIVETIQQEVERYSFRPNQENAYALNEFVDSEIGYILLDSIPVYRPQKIKYLSRYLKGYLSANHITTINGAFELKLKNPTQLEANHYTSFLIKSKLSSVDYVLNIYEKEYFESSELHRLGKETQNRMYPKSNKDVEKTVITDVFVTYGISGSNSELNPEHKVYVNPMTNTFVKSKNSEFTDFDLHEIKHFNIPASIVHYSFADNKLEIKKGIMDYLKENSHLIESTEQLKALLKGLFHNVKTISEVIHVHENVFQIGFIKRIQGTDPSPVKRLFVFNVAFGSKTQDNLKALEHLRNRANVGDYEITTRSLSISVTKEAGVTELDTFVLDDNYLTGLVSCLKVRRRRREAACQYPELEQLKNEKVYPVVENSETPRGGLIASKSSRSLKYLSHLNKFSAGIMYGLMAKNLISDIIHGNIQGIAVNAGFIISNVMSNRLASKLMTKATELAQVERLALASALRVGAPFLRRLPSFAFVGFDLYNSIKAYKNNEPDAMVSIGADGAYIALDVAETAIEVAEVFGLIEGVSAVTGPIGWAAGAAILVGADIYKSVKTVERIDNVIQLTKLERFTEGVRAFFGMGPEQHITELMNQKQEIGNILPRMAQFLEQHPNMIRYIFPMKSIKKSARLEISIDLRRKIEIERARSITDPPQGFDYFCEFEPNQSNEGPKRSLYLCKYSLGLESSKQKASNLTYIQLGDGDEEIYGMIDSPNVFDVIGNGRKVIHGGQSQNTFIVRNNTNLHLAALGEKHNLLDLSNVGTKNSLEIENEHISHKDQSQQETFRFKNVDGIIGRKRKAEKIKCWCNLRYLELQGGSQPETDQITIEEDIACTYDLTINFGEGDTEIFNDAIVGNFTYSFSNLSGVTFVKLPEQSKQYHKFVLNYMLEDFISIWTQSTNVDVFVCLETKRNAGVCIHMLLGTNNYQIMFKDGATLTLKRDHGVVMVSTLDSLERASDLYSTLISNSTVTLIINSMLNNETMTMNRGQHKSEKDYAVNIIYNDPNSKHHMRGSLHESIYVIKAILQKMGKLAQFRMETVSIYTSNHPHHKDIIDLTQLEQQVKSSDIKNQLTIESHKENQNIVLSLKFTTENRTTKIGDVIIRGALEKESYKFVTIHKSAPLTIDFFNNSTIHLKPVPLTFDPTKNFIVLTPNDNLEYGMDIECEKSIGRNYKFLNVNNTSLIVTNIMHKIPQDFDSVITIILQDFYSNDLMKSLTLSFLDEKLDLKTALNGNIENFASVELELKKMFMKSYFWWNS